MKRIFALAMALIVTGTAAVLSAGTAFGVVEENGYAVPASAAIPRALVADEAEGAPIALVELRHEDTVYHKLTGYYVGEERKQIDINYPIYVNGGVGIRFFDEANWLVTPEADLLQSFDGLYVSEGVSYGVDMTRADEEEFIFLTLSNGLYMNVQAAKFTNRLGTVSIPSNSILSLREDGLSWYAYRNGVLEYSAQSVVFDATFTVGEHEYEYTALLDALGLLRRALEKGDHNRPDEEILEQAGQVLLPNPKGGNGKHGSNANGTNTSDSDRTGGNRPGVTPPGDTVSDSNETGEGPETGTPGGATDPQTGKDNNPSTQTPGGTSGAVGGENQTPSGSGDGADLSGGTGDEGGSSSDDPSGGSSDGSSGSGDSSGDGTSGGGSESGSSAPGSPSTETGSGSGASGGSGEIPSGGGTDAGDILPPSGDSGSSETGEEGAGEDSQKIPYREPEVTVDVLEEWSYAMAIRALVDDPSGAITRGVRFAVYSKLKGSGPRTVNAQGQTVYRAEDYTGQSLMLRKTRYGTQSFTLNPLKPNGVVYLQYNYRYYDESPIPGGAIDENGNPEMQRTRINYYSDFIEVRLPSVEEGGVEPVAIDWETLFAASSDGLSLQIETVENTAAYDPAIDAETYDFDNFKLNSLPYLNRMELTLTPIQGKGRDTVTLSVSNNILIRAQKDPLLFQSSSPKLESNTVYTYTAKLLDRYGFEMPVRINGMDGGVFTDTVYTAKRRPVVTIDEQENLEDKLTLRFTVSDPDGALPADEPLQLKFFYQDTPVALYGTWADGTPFGNSDTNEIELSEPADGKTYTMTFESLAFSRLFTVSVKGDWLPQPDAVSEPALPRETAQEFGRSQVYTASLSGGLVDFTTSFSDVLDTSATFNAVMTPSTTLEILPLVDEFRVFFTDPNGVRVGETVTLTAEELINMETPALTEGEIVLREGNSLTPHVALVGREEQLGDTAWESFCVKEVLATDPETGESVEAYTNPLQLRVALPKTHPEGYLKNYTRYTVTIQAVVIKGGEEYLIPVKLTNDWFTTKKTIPEVKMAELFIASDKAHFIGLWIQDPDATIQKTTDKDENASIQLYYGETLLKTRRIAADQTPNGTAPRVNITFDGLIPGANYTVKVVADAYNDEAGYGAYEEKKVLWSRPFIGGSDLTGTLNLTALSAEAGSGAPNLAENLASQLFFDNTATKTSGSTHIPISEKLHQLRNSVQAGYDV